MSINEIFNEKIISDFLDKIFDNLQKDNIDVSNYELDHICYRVSSVENYNFLKENIDSFWFLLSEEVVSWRPIATIKLFSPILYKNRQISVLEIPSPKVWSDYEDGFQHVEFVINETFDDFINKYQNINFDYSWMTKDYNKELWIKYWNLWVKFHNDSLENVVRLEEKASSE